MKLDLFHDIITIDIDSYKSDAGWNIFNDIPEELIGEQVTVEIDGFNYDAGEPFRLQFGIILEDMLDDILYAIVNQIRALIENVRDPRGIYFEEHRFLETLELDTNTRILQASFGS